MDFCVLLTSYFYKNLSCPYYVPDCGAPAAFHRKLKETDSFPRHRVTNQAVTYVGVDGTMKIELDAISPKIGDLFVDEKNSFYLGRHIIRRGDRPQTYRRSPDPMMEFYHSYKKIFDENEVFVDNAIVVNGCFKTNKRTLQQTMIPELESEFAKFPSLGLVKKKKKAIKAVIRKLRIPQLAKAEKEDMYESKFNLNTYPGFTYSEYFGKKDKRAAVDIAMCVAETRWENIQRFANKGRLVPRNYLFPNTYVVGARNKREIDYEVGEAISSRAVHMPELHSELNSSVWIDPINEFIKDEGRGCIYIGNSFVQYERLLRDLEDANTILEGDVKRFDASLYITDIIIAVALSRLYYDLDSFEIDNHFVAIFDTVAIKDYYTPGGFIYRLIHGLPSGVKATSLYGSFINLVNLAFSCSKFDLKRIKFIVGSDDFLISSESSISQQGILEIEEISLNIGIRFKFLKEKKLHAEEINDRPVFYKYTIDRNEPVIPTNVVLERTFIPWSQAYKDDASILKFLFDLMPSMAAPRSHLILYYKFFSVMYYRVTKTELSILDVYQMHEGIYKGIIEKKYFRRRDPDKVPTSIKSQVDIRVAPSKVVFEIFRSRYRKKDCLFAKFVKEKRPIYEINPPA